MRPPKLKTTLSVLRNMLTHGEEEKRRRDKKSGLSFPVLCPKRLTKKTVALWLGCSVSNVEKIEAGASLTRENAEILMQQTGISANWLLGKNTKKPISFLGSPYEQKHFDRAQASVNHPNFPALRAQEEFASGVASLATILLHACQRDEIKLYASKVRNSFREIFAMFPKNETFVDFGDCVDRTTTTMKGHDFKPLLKKWNYELVLQVQEKKRQKLAAADSRRRA